MDWAPSPAFPREGWGNHPEGGEQGCTGCPRHGHASPLGWEQGDSTCPLLLVPPRLRWAPASPLQTAAAEGGLAAQPWPRSPAAQDRPRREEPWLGPSARTGGKILWETRLVSGLILPPRRVQPRWVHCAGEQAGLLPADNSRGRYAGTWMPAQEIGSGREARTPGSQPQR